MLAPVVITELEGKSAGEVIEVPIDCGKLNGPRDESLVITERIQNVSQEYREVGTAIQMENDKGQTKSFLITRADAKSVNIEGDNCLCAREVIFKLETFLVRDATPEQRLNKAL